MPRTTNYAKISFISDWHALVVPVLKNPGTNLSHVTDVNARRTAENLLDQQLEYCSHLNFCTAMIPVPVRTIQDDYFENLAQILYSKLSSGLTTTVRFEIGNM